MTKEQIFKKHYKLASGKEADAMVMRCMAYCLDAMEEYRDVSKQQLIEKVGNLYRSIIAADPNCTDNPDDCDHVIKDLHKQCSEVLKDLKKI